MASNKMTPAQAAEQSRIATAQGMRDIAAAMAARGPVCQSDDSDDSYFSDSSDSSKKRNRKKKHVKTSPNTNKDEVRAHYLQLELVNANVDLDDSRQEVAKFKSYLEPYSKFNNDMAFLKSSIERSNKEISQLTLSQLEKRLKLFKEEYNEFSTLCSVSISKMALPEVNSALSRVLVVEKRRALNEEKKLLWSIFVRKTTITIVKSTLISLVSTFVFLLFYWYCLRNIKMPKLYINPRLL